MLIRVDFKRTWVHFTGLWGKSDKKAWEPPGSNQVHITGTLPYV